MENYIFLKGKLLRNLRESEYAVLNYDDEEVRNFAQKTKANVVYFSLRQQIEGAYYQNGAIYFKGEKYLDVKDMTVKGEHNVYNALACVAAAHVLGLDKSKVAEALCSFKGIKHRIEEVARDKLGLVYEGEILFKDEQ